MNKLLTTKEIAEFLNINEKMVYSLVSEKAMPATKIAGKWLFPQYLIEQWVENNTINFPENIHSLASNQRLVVLAGSNDLMLDKAITLFNRSFNGHLAVFGNIGSAGGVQALRNNLCHIAASHLIQDDEQDYNFEFVSQEFTKMPVVINFCKREQGLIVIKNNPLGITSIADFGRPGLRMVNRSLSTGTRLLLDKELKKAGIRGDKIIGYQNEVARHIDVGLAVLTGEADIGLGIRPVADNLGLDFIPLRWERFDLLVAKDTFFEQSIQNFFGLLLTEEFRALGSSIPGYDLATAGKIVYQ